MASKLTNVQRNSKTYWSLLNYSLGNKNNSNSNIVLGKEICDIFPRKNRNFYVQFLQNNAH